MTSHSKSHSKPLTQRLNWIFGVLTSIAGGLFCIFGVHVLWLSGYVNSLYQGALMVAAGALVFALGILLFRR